jgi:NitT/TauT family transport system substrate-binding protein
MLKVKMMLRHSPLFGLVLLLVACGGAAPAAPAASTATSELALTKVTLALSYIPNVQFAPYYVAQQKGYYREAGIDVVFDYNFETDTLQRAATAPTDAPIIAHGSGLSVMLARQQGIPVKMVMQQYQQFPVVFFGKADVQLTSPTDLQGLQIGIPGRFGASYYALLALLYASDQQERDLNVQEVGFSQFQLVLEDKIDVAAGYAMNEPVRLREATGGASILRVADFFPLVADGLIVSDQLIAERPELVQGFVEASMRGLRDTLENPDEAFEISLAFIPEANLSTPEFERVVLQESLPYWTSARLGAMPETMWADSHQFLLDLGLLQSPIEVEQAYTNAFVE